MACKPEFGADLDNSRFLFSKRVAASREIPVHLYHGFNPAPAERDSGNEVRISILLWKMRQ